MVVDLAVFIRHASVRLAGLYPGYLGLSHFGRVGVSHPRPSLAPRRGYAGSAARPASHVFCCAPNEDAALGFRLVPVFAVIVRYRIERLPFV